MVYWRRKCEGTVCVGNVGHKMGDLSDVGIEELSERSKESIEFIESAESVKDVNPQRQCICVGVNDPINSKELY